MVGVAFDDRSVKTGTARGHKVKLKIDMLDLFCFFFGFTRHLIAPRTNYAIKATLWP